MRHSAFVISNSDGRPYISVIGSAFGAPSGPKTMTFFARLFATARQPSMASVNERRRLNKSMPGEAAALAANRLGGLVM
jgi:hypothetical protein